MKDKEMHNFYANIQIISAISTRTQL